MAPLLSQLSGANAIPAAALVYAAPQCGASSSGSAHGRPGAAARRPSNFSFAKFLIAFEPIPRGELMPFAMAPWVHVDIALVHTPTAVTAKILCALTA